MQKSTIDVWVTHDQSLDLKGSVSLELQLAHILHLTDVWSDHTNLRLVRSTRCAVVPLRCCSAIAC